MLSLSLLCIQQQHSSDRCSAASVPKMQSCLNISVTHIPRLQYWGLFSFRQSRCQHKRKSVSRLTRLVSGSTCHLSADRIGQADNPALYPTEINTSSWLKTSASARWEGFPVINSEDWNILHKAASIQTCAVDDEARIFRHILVGGLLAFLRKRSGAYNAVDLKNKHNLL